MITFVLATYAQAHEVGLSSVFIEADGLTVSLANDDWEAVSGDFGPSSVSLTVNGTACVLAPPTLTPEDDGVLVHMSSDCPHGQDMAYQAGFLDDLGPGHRHYVESSGAAVAVVDAAEPGAEFQQGEQSLSATGAEFANLGVEHILIGYDHLAFLLALLLVARTSKEIIGVVSGFTVAHSITLSLAALGLVNPPGAIVEIAIAASIAYAGFENLVEPSAKRRFVLTFVLGLIHGFGFAGVLTELGLPQGNLVAALLSFNVGVELGQLALVGLVFPLLMAARKSEKWRKKGVPALSIAIALLGCFWVVERCVGLM